MFIGLAYALLWAAMLSFIAHAASSRQMLRRAATGITLIAWGVLTAGLIERSLNGGHWPLTNRYEFALCWGWVIVAIQLLLQVSRRRHLAGACVLTGALVVMTYAVTRPATEQAIRPLQPVLRSVWLQIHVLTALVGYGSFGVAAGLGLALLIPASIMIEKNQDECESAMMQVVLLGFPWLTLSILSGAIWAQNAWGRYWGWDPKETWALVTWLWYLLIMHLRPLRRWHGRRLAALIIVGFGMVLFAFLGVPWLVRVVRLESLHGF